MNETITIILPAWVAWPFVLLSVLSLINTIQKLYIMYLRRKLAALGKAGG